MKKLLLFHAKTIPLAKIAPECFEIAKKVNISILLYILRDLKSNVPNLQKLSFGVGSSPKTIETVSKIAENVNVTGTGDLKIFPLLSKIPRSGKTLFHTHKTSVFDPDK